jgi:uncharacterized membrane protein YadS
VVRHRLRHPRRIQQPHRNPADARTAIVALTTFLLTVALAAMGLETDISKLYEGIRPAVLGALA